MQFHFVSIKIALRRPMLHSTFHRYLVNDLHLVSAMVVIYTYNFDHDNCLHVSIHIRECVTQAVILGM